MTRAPFLAWRIAAVVALVAIAFVARSGFARSRFVRLASDELRDLCSFPSDVAEAAAAAR